MAQVLNYTPEFRVNYFTHLYEENVDLITRAFGKIDSCITYQLYRVFWGRRGRGVYICILIPSQLDWYRELVEF